MDEFKTNWVPPVPPEHGAKTILAVGLLTPPAVAAGLNSSFATGTVLEYSIFALIAVDALFFREAVRQFVLADSGDKTRIGIIAIGEALVLFGLSSCLVVRIHPVWWVGFLLPPAIITSNYLGRRSNLNPVIRAGIGASVLGGLVPVGLIILGVTELLTIGIVTLVFLTYHALAIIRVGAVVTTGNLIAKAAVGVSLVLVGLAVLGLFANAVGPAVILLFVLSAGHTVRLVSIRDTPSLKRIGQFEAVLSALFVVGSPFLLP